MSLIVITSALSNFTKGRIAAAQGHHNHHTTTILLSFFWDHPDEPVPEENFWTFWCKRRLTVADTQTIRLGATPSRLTSAHRYHPTRVTSQMESRLIQPFCTAHGRMSLYFTMGRFVLPQKYPFIWGDLDRHLMHGSFSPPESTTQAASRSVQLFLHSSWS